MPPPNKPEDELEDDFAVDVSNDVARELAAAAESDDDDGDDLGADTQIDEDSGENDDEDEGLSASDVPAGKKKKQTLDDRISELTRRAKDAEKAAFEAEMKLIEREKASEPALSAPSKAVKEPDPKDFVYGEVDTDYLEALLEYRVEAKLANQREEFEASKRAEEATKVQQRYQTKVQEVMEQGKKVHKDFEDIVGSTTFDGHLARLVVDSEAAVDIAYYLGNNTSELLKVTRASPEERARMIGRLEGKFSATSAARKKTTNAPEPIGQGRRAPATGSEAKYGPSSQDDFDKAFYGR